MVGAGAIAQAYAQCFQQCQTAEVVAVADVREEAAVAIATMLKCDSRTSYEELLRRSDIDAVLVCTPPVTHPEICISFLQNGIATLCEKPLAITSGDAREIIAIAEKHEVKFAMASKFRCVDDVINAKAILTSGVVGEIILFENVFATHVDMTNRWNSVPEISGGGVLIDNGTHSVDIMRYFLGPLTELQVVEGKRLQPLPVEDTVRLFVRTINGEMGSIDLSWSLNKQLPNYISIYGSQGIINVGWKVSRYRRSSDDDWIVFGSGYNKHQALKTQIENFSRAICGEQTLLISPEDALASVEVIESAYQALNENCWVPVTTNNPLSARG